MVRASQRIARLYHSATDPVLHRASRVKEFALGDCFAEVASEQHVETSADTIVLRVGTTYAARTRCHGLPPVATDESTECCLHEVASVSRAQVAEDASHDRTDHAEHRVVDFWMISRAEAGGVVPAEVHVRALLGRPLLRETAVSTDHPLASTAVRLPRRSWAWLLSYRPHTLARCAPRDQPIQVHPNSKTTTEDSVCSPTSSHGEDQVHHDPRQGRA